MNEVRVGIIGAGVIGRRHLQAGAAAPHLVKLQAVADLRPQVLDAVVGEFGVASGYADGADLIADPHVDAVVLAVPAGGRSDLAAAALRAGKHVLLEKPPARNANELRQLRDLQGDRVIACCSARFSLYPSAAACREYVAAGALGALRELYVRAASPAGPPGAAPPPAWRVSHGMNGGGILVNWCSYDLDFLLGLTGWTVEPQVAFAQVWPVAPALAAGRVDPASDADCHAVALIRCTDGVMIHLERAEFSSLRNEAVWQIVGERASMQLRMVGGKKQIEVDEVDPAHGVSSRVLWTGEEERNDIHKAPLRDFAKAIKSGRPPQTGLDQALVLQRIFDAVYASARSATAVPV